MLRVADERSVDLIVVGLRRRSPVRMALLGSNAQHIILSAQCPVLSIRPSPECGPRQSSGRRPLTFPITTATTVTR